MNGFEIKKALKGGGTVCGTLVVSPSPKWPMYVKQTGIDFVFIDTEHVMLDSMTLSWMCMTYSAMNLASIVRIPSADPARATAVLDGGAQGVLVPYVESEQVIREMAGAVHSRPVKGRKLREMLDGTRAFPPSVNAAVAEKNRNNMLFVNIESVPAMETLDRLLAVEGLDGIVIGPNDLSYSMDVPNEYSDPRFQEAVVGILSKAREKGVACGVHALGEIGQQIEWAQKSGMNMLWHSGDIYAFVNGIKQDIARYRRETGHSDRSGGAVSMEI